MKYLKSMLLLAFIAISMNAGATEYVVFKQRFFGGYKLIYVGKPKKLDRWYYDSKNDTYYRAKSWAGVPASLKVVKKMD